MSIINGFKTRHQWQAVNDVFGITLPFSEGSGCWIRDPILLNKDAVCDSIDAADIYVNYYGIMRGLEVTFCHLELYEGYEKLIGEYNVEVYDAIDDKKWEESYWFDLTDFFGWETTKQI
jgi:hypothetical protein